MMMMRYFVAAAAGVVVVLEFCLLLHLSVVLEQRVAHGFVFRPRLWFRRRRRLGVLRSTSSTSSSSSAWDLFKFTPSADGKRALGIGTSCTELRKEEPQPPDFPPPEELLDQKASDGLSATGDGETPIVMEAVSSEESEGSTDEPSEEDAPAAVVPDTPAVDWSSASVAELTKELKRRSFSVDGRRSELALRLIENDAEIAEVAAARAAEAARAKAAAAEAAKAAAARAAEEAAAEVEAERKREADREAALQNTISSAQKYVVEPLLSVRLERDVNEEAVKGAALIIASLSALAGKGVIFSGAAGLGAAAVAVSKGTAGQTARAVGELTWNLVCSALKLGNIESSGQLVDKTAGAINDLVRRANEAQQTEYASQVSSAAATKQDIELKQLEDEVNQALDEAKVALETTAVEIAGTEEKKQEEAKDGVAAAAADDEVQEKLDRLDGDAELKAVDWSKRTVPQLKAELRRRGLPVGGRKADLVERLQQGAVAAAAAAAGAVVAARDDTSALVQEQQEGIVALGDDDEEDTMWEEAGVVSEAEVEAEAQLDETAAALEEEGDYVWEVEEVVGEEDVLRREQQEDLVWIEEEAGDDEEEIEEEDVEFGIEEDDEDGVVEFEISDDENIDWDEKEEDLGGEEEADAGVEVDDDDDEGAFSEDEFMQSIRIAQDSLDADGGEKIAGIDDVLDELDELDEEEEEEVSIEMQVAAAMAAKATDEALGAFEAQRKPTKEELEMQALAKATDDALAAFERGQEREAKARVERKIFWADEMVQEDDVEAVASTEPVAEEEQEEEEDASAAEIAAADRPPQDWSKLTVAKLKEELKSRGLPLSGRKADLVAVLEASDRRLADEEGEEEEDEEDDDFFDDDAAFDFSDVEGDEEEEAGASSLEVSDWEGDGEEEIVFGAATEGGEVEVDEEEATIELSDWEGGDGEESLFDAAAAGEGKVGQEDFELSDWDASEDEGDVVAELEDIQELTLGAVEGEETKGIQGRRGEEEEEDWDDDDEGFNLDDDDDEWTSGFAAADSSQQPRFDAEDEPSDEALWEIENEETEGPAAAAAAYETMTVPELKAELKKLGLRVGGKKADLIERLQSSS